MFNQILFFQNYINFTFINMNQQNQHIIFPQIGQKSFPLHHEEEGNLNNYINQVQNLFVMMMHSIINKNITQEQGFNFSAEKIFNYKDKGSQSQNQYKILIGNNAYQKQNYGSEFDVRLDPRDQLLEHKFNFDVTINYSLLKEEKNMRIEETTAFKPLCDKVNIYLVKIVENITSVSFNLLTEGKLTNSETKDFAAKNILLNVNLLFKEIIKNVRLQKFVKNQEILKIIRNQKYQQKFETEICLFIDETLKTILQNIISYYPQAPSAGSSPKMKKGILSIDRNDNQELDFLMMNKLKIQRQKDGDYSQFIMRVMNKIIQIPDFQDDSQNTLFQKFVNFSQSLFWMSKKKKINKKQKKSQNIQGQMKKQIDKNVEIANLFYENQQNQIDKNTVQYLKQEFLFSKMNNKFQLFQQETEKRKEIDINEMKKQHIFSINKKLPNGIELFSPKNIKNKEFNVTNSSMLRILTKWAENLMHIFEHPEAYTIDRIYPFKTIKHQIFHADQQIKKQLYHQIIKKKQEIDKFNDKLLRNNTVFQSRFLNTDNKQFTKFVKRYTQTRILASNMNDLLIKLMKQFISKLIHLLIEAGTIVNKYDQNKFDHEIDLVTFRLGDLMRSKVYCTESSFLYILKTLYTLDEEKIKGQQKQLVKLVRIKNKLNTKDNNILINYVFMGQIQCQLQMSVQRMEHKQQNFNDFNHFLYELIRGKFGILTQCAIIIAQLDPIVAASGSNHSIYKPKKKKIIQKNNIQNSKSQLFICSKCQELKHQKIQFLQFLQDQQNKQDYQCDICRIKKTSFNKQNLLKDKKLKATINQLKQNKYIEVVGDKTYLYLKNLITSSNNNPSLLISVTPGSSELNFELVGYLQCQSMLYSTIFSPQIINQMLTQKEFKSISNKKPQFSDLTSLINKQKLLPYFTYIAKGISNIELVIKHFKFKDVKGIQGRINKLRIIIQNLIMQEKALNKIKNKIENLVFKNQQQLTIFGNMIPKKGSIHTLESIELIFSQSLNIEQLPKWISNCSNLKILDIKYNRIRQISNLINCNLLTELYLQNNPIDYINFKQFQKCWQNLKVLIIKKNNFNNIQLCNFPKLITLNICKCQYLKKLQLKNYPRLQKLQIQNNYQLCSLKLKEYPQLQTLNISINPQLNYLQLKEYLQLQALNISSNYSLSTLELQKFPKLQTLDICSNYKLQTLQLQEYSNLKSLNISINQKLSSLILKEYQQLQNLNISWNLSLLSLELKEYSKLRYLNISGNSKLPLLQLRQYQKLQTLIIVYNNQLPSLQLKKYPQLRTLIISENDLLPSIQMEDYPLLQTLQIYRNSQIVQLNLIQYPELKMLKIYRNQSLYFMNLQKLPELRTLQIFKNDLLTNIAIKQFSKLQKLKIVQNGSLSFLQLQDLPQLQTLNISLNQQLCSLQLKMIPRLSALNISQNKELSALQIKQFEQLRTLNILSNNKLSSVRLERLKLLQKLKISNNNNISQLQLKKFPSLKSLEIFKNQLLSSLQLKDLPSLQNINISWNQSLSSLQLNEFPMIQSLNIFKNDSLTTLKLKDYQKLQKLNIVNNKLLISLQLKKYPNLQQLVILENKQLSSIQLKDYPHLQTIQVSQNESLKSLKLNKYPQLQILDISWNKLLSSISLNELPQLQALTIFKNDALKILKIPNLKELLVLDVSFNCNECQLKLGSLPKLVKLHIEGLRMKLNQIEWQLNKNGVEFVGDNQIQDSIKVKQPNIEIVKNKEWNRQWNELKQLQQSRFKTTDKQLNSQVVEKRQQLL